MTTSSTRVACTAAGLVAALAAIEVPAAVSAAPTNAAHVTTGTADCGAAGTFTFVVTNNSGRGTPWNVAFLTSADGSRALFHPASLNLTFTSAAGSFSFTAAKHSGAGPVSCSIASASDPNGTLTGTVTGSITRLG